MIGIVQFPKPVEAEDREQRPILVLAIANDQALTVDAEGGLWWRNVSDIRLSWRYEEETADWLVIGGEGAEGETQEDDRDPEVS